MTKGTSKSTDADKHFDYVFNVMRENEKFLLENAEVAYDEIIWLINEAIDYVGFSVNGEKSKENYVGYSMVFFVHNIIMPFSYAIQTDLLSGNLPVCFMELRLMLESLAKCYLADLKYPDLNSFQEKLELLEKEIKSKDGKNISKREHDFMEEFDRELGSNRSSIELWGKLSQDWVHTKGIVNRIINEKSDAPSWAFMIPIKYTNNDLYTIDELGKRVSQFRSLLKVTMGKYQL
jgi:hypothetical protein